ncbi:hypothetical protein P4S63_19465 [Pseudoalteromonas sp. B193]
MAQQSSFSAPLKSKVQTHDIDEQAHSLTQWQQKYDQMSDGSFYGCIEETDYANIHVFKEYTERALRQQCNIALIRFGSAFLVSHSKVKLMV